MPPRKEHAAVQDQAIVQAIPRCEALSIVLDVVVAGIILRKPTSSRDLTFQLPELLQVSSLDWPFTDRFSLTFFKSQSEALRANQDIISELFRRFFCL